MFIAATLSLCFVLTDELDDLLKDSRYPLKPDGTFVEEFCRDTDIIVLSHEFDVPAESYDSLFIQLRPIGFDSLFLECPVSLVRRTEQAFENGGDINAVMMILQAELKELGEVVDLDVVKFLFTSEVIPWISARDQGLVLRGIYPQRLGEFRDTLKTLLTKSSEATREDLASLLDIIQESDSPSNAEHETKCRAILDEIAKIRTTTRSLDGEVITILRSIEATAHFYRRFAQPEDQEASKQSYLEWMGEHFDEVLGERDKSSSRALVKLEPWNDDQLLKNLWIETTDAIRTYAEKEGRTVKNVRMTTPESIDLSMGVGMARRLRGDLATRDEHIAVDLRPMRLAQSEGRALDETKFATLIQMANQWDLLIIAADRRPSLVTKLANSQLHYVILGEGKPEGDVLTILKQRLKAQGIEGERVTASGPDDVTVDLEGLASHEIANLRWSLLKRGEVEVRLVVEAEDGHELVDENTSTLLQKLSKLPENVRHRLTHVPIGEALAWTRLSPALQERLAWDEFPWLLTRKEGSCHLTHDDLKDFRLTLDPEGKIAVGFDIVESKQDQIHAGTKANIGIRLAFVVDDVIEWLARISSPFSDSVQCGSFERGYAEALVAVAKYPFLGFKLQERTD